MADTPTTHRDDRDTVFLPKTDLPMKAGLLWKESGILARWQAMNLYGKTRDARRGAEKSILRDGPPYANGAMHIGHALAKVSVGDTLSVTRTDYRKCGRCWRPLPDVPEDGALGELCAKVVA